MKKTILEIFVIISVAVAIALIYNIIRTDGIPFFPKNKEELLVKDDVLFDKEIPNEIDTNKLSNDTVKQIDTNNKSVENIDSTKKDTLTKAKNDSIDVEKLLENTKKTAQSDFPYVNYEQVTKIVGHKDFIIIDARRPELYAQSHLANAINIFPGWEENEVIEKILQLPQNKKIVIYCDGGNCDLSEEIAVLLDNFGYKRFYIYGGGWEEWSKKQKIK